MPGRGSIWVIAFNNYRHLSILRRSSRLDVSIINILSQIILVVGAVLCIVGLHPLDATSEYPRAPQDVTMTDVSRGCPIPLGCKLTSS